MVKKIVLVVALLAVGVAIAMYMRSGGSSGKPVQAFTPRTDASETERIADLEKTVATLVDRINLLESHIGQLGNRSSTTRRTADGSTDPRGDRRNDFRQQFTDANGNFDPAKMRDQFRKQQLDRLVQAGFTQDKAEWIERREQELELQQQQARFDAQRTGQPAQNVDPEATLRKELGDADYEKYLTATGRPTNVQVMDVLASSPAEKAGLKPGDQIVSYAGQRVYDNNDLNSLARQGTPGESVTVEVQRDGQTI
ncbi:MAG TPA: PDZ domain-containing protein, partial [Steroidobacteraceae bacterium]|nr:PDZ domain-containing protein [Steroidobacteraceae bacterium]